MKATNVIDTVKSANMVPEPSLCEIKMAIWHEFFPCSYSTSYTIYTDTHNISHINKTNRFFGTNGWQ